MALVPIVQPPVIRALTTKHERRIRMGYTGTNVSKRTKILFPIFVTILTGIVSPRAVALIGFLMFGNLLRECGVLDALSETAQKVLANLITLLLGITVASKMTADAFLNWQTLMILGLGLVAFIFDTVGGVLFAKLLNLFCKNKINPMIGAAGISAFPMSARVVHKMGLAEDNQNFLLMHAVGVNVSGQIASVIAERQYQRKIIMFSIYVLLTILRNLHLFMERQVRNVILCVVGEKTLIVRADIAEFS